MVCKKTCPTKLPVPHADENGCKGVDGRELAVRFMLNMIFDAKGDGFILNE